MAQFLPLQPIPARSATARSEIHLYQPLIYPSFWIFFDFINSSSFLSVLVKLGDNLHPMML